MIRLTPRQFRTEAVAGLGALGVVADPARGHWRAPHGRVRRLPGCLQGGQVLRHGVQPGIALDSAATPAVLFVATVAPALVGVFFGAPLIARELESGTFRLAWTQGVTRARWLMVKLALVGLASSVLAGGLSLMVAWWANPINIVNQNRFSPSLFGMFGSFPSATRYSPLRSG